MVQVINGRMYIAGEIEPFMSVQDSFKSLLANVWARYSNELPDVDMMIQTDDWMIPNMEGGTLSKHWLIWLLKTSTTGICSCRGTGAYKPLAHVRSRQSCSDLVPHGPKMHSDALKKQRQSISGAQA